MSSIKVLYNGQYYMAEELNHGAEYQLIPLVGKRCEVVPESMVTVVEIDGKPLPPPIDIPDPNVPKVKKSRRTDDPTLGE